MAKRPLAWTVLPLVILLLGSAPTWAGETPVRGGTLRYAMIDTPPSLDAHILTATLSTTVSQHFLETLFTFTENYEPVPFLAKGAEVRDGGKLILIQLRQGVLFHNGKEMTSDDVVASLNRWGKFGARAPALFQQVERVSADGKYGVRIQLKNPFAPWATHARLCQRRADDLPQGGHGERHQGAHRSQGLHRHRAVSVRRVEGRPRDHPGAVRQVREAHREARRLRRRAHGLLRQDHLRPGIGPGDPRERDQGGGVRLRREHPGGPLRGPRQGFERPDHDPEGGGLRRALLQPEGGHDDQSEASPGHAGRHQHGAGAAGVVRPGEALGGQRRPDVPGHQVVHEGRTGGLQPEQSRPRPRRWPRRRGTRGNPSATWSPPPTPTTTPPASCWRSSSRTRASTSTCRSTTGPPWSRGARSPGSGTCTSPPTGSCRIRSSSPS